MNKPNHRNSRQYVYEPSDAAYFEKYGLRGFNDYWTRLEAARGMNLDSVIEAMIHSYNNMRSSEAAALFDMTKDSLLRHMRRCGIQKPIGGANVPPAKTVQGKPCPVCGSTEKYEKHPQCAPCHRRINREAYWRKRAA